MENQGIVHYRVCADDFRGCGRPNLAAELEGAKTAFLIGGRLENVLASPEEKAVVFAFDSEGGGRLIVDGAESHEVIRADWGLLAAILFSEEKVWEHAKDFLGMKPKAGRKPSYTQEKADKVRELRLRGHSLRAIAKEVNLSVGTVQRILS